MVSLDTDRGSTAGAEEREKIWSKSHTEHSGGAEWKVGLGKNKTPTSNKKITVDANTGKIIKVNK